MRPSARKADRRGAILPLFGLLLVVLLAMTAFAVDIGYIVSVQSQLQNAADAAALAGAAELMQPYVQYYYPLQTPAVKAQVRQAAIDSARARARQFAAL